MKIYLLSGLGGDERIFGNLNFPEGFTTHFIAWQHPHRDEPLQDYVKRLAEAVDTSSPFILCGVSFGGICVQEMCSFLGPKKLILISTITAPAQIPSHMKVGGAANWKDIVPTGFYKWVASRSAPVVGLRGRKKTTDFKEMIDQFEPYYFKWAVNEVGNWEGAKITVPTLRLHGTSDKVFPVSRVGNAELIEGGEHIMVMEQPEPLEEKIREFLENA